MNLLKNVALANMVTLCSLLSISSTFSAENEEKDGPEIEHALSRRFVERGEASALRPQELESETNNSLARANSLNYRLKDLHQVLLGTIGKFLKGVELVNFLSICKDIKQCAEYAREHRFVSLSGSSFSYPNFFRDLQGVNHLSLVLHTSYNNPILTQIDSLYNLQYLSLRNCPAFTDIDLGRISLLINLKNLNLFKLLNVTDAGLVPISGMPNLQILTLWDLPQITDAGLSSVGETPMLQKLYLKKQPGITNAAVVRLNGIRPNLQVKR